MCYMTWENSNISLLHFIALCRYCSLKMCQLCNEQVYWYHSSKSFVLKLMQIFKVCFLDITWLHTYKTKYSINITFLFACFWQCLMACGIFVPPPEIEPMTPELESWSLNQGTDAEVQTYLLYILGSQNISLLWFVNQLVMCPKFTSRGNPHT